MEKNSLIFSSFTSLSVTLIVTFSHSDRRVSICDQSINLWPKYQFETKVSIESRMELMWDCIENGILTFFCTAFPVLFSIFCFPVVLLLRFSKDFCYFWFSYIFPVLAGRLKRHLAEPKAILFRDLISEPNPNVTILEVGIGTGANFAFYPKVK